MSFGVIMCNHSPLKGIIVLSIYSPECHFIGYTDKSQLERIFHLQTLIIGGGGREREREKLFNYHYVMIILYIITNGLYLLKLKPPGVKMVPRLVPVN